MIASISSSPALLGAAGLLDDHKYCGGLYDEFVEDLPFMHRENFMHVPLLQDGNLITAMGYAYREFAFCVSDYFGIDFDKRYFGPLADNFDDLGSNWSMSEELMEEWKNTLKDLKEIYCF